MPCRTSAMFTDIIPIEHAWDVIGDEINVRHLAGMVIIITRLFPGTRDEIGECSNLSINVMALLVIEQICIIRPPFIQHNNHMFYLKCWKTTLKWNLVLLVLNVYALISHFIIRNNQSFGSSIHFKYGSCLFHVLYLA